MYGIVAANTGEENTKKIKTHTQTPHGDRKSRKFPEPIIICSHETCGRSSKKNEIPLDNQGNILFLLKINMRMRGRILKFYEKLKNECELSCNNT